MNYSLELRNPYFYKKKFSIALLHFTAGFLLVNAWYQSNIMTNIPFLDGFLLFIALFEMVYTFFAFKMMHKYPQVNGIIRIVTALSFLIYSLLFFGQHQAIFAVFMLIISIAFLMIYFIEKKWAQPFVIDINEQGVLFPGTFKTPLIPWKKLNHLILKDSILTLDLTSNHLVQLELRQITDKNRIAEINHFCKEKCLK